MTLSPGTRLGSYEILAPLGAGGMGEVYRARDTRLERTVAIQAEEVPGRNPRPGRSHLCAARDRSSCAGRPPTVESGSPATTAS